MTEILAQITAPYFCAGLELRNDVVFKTAPILKYMIGWTILDVRSYAKRNGWKVSVVR